MIPKIIHQIWFQGLKNLPQEYELKRRTWTKLNPYYEYIVWDEESMNYIISNIYPQYLKVFNNFKFMHQKIDFFKYLVLYIFGGIYSDMDTVNLNPLDSLLDKFPNSEIIVGKLAVNNVESYMLSGFPETINNGIIMGVRKHNIFKELIDSILLNKNKYFTKYSEINNTTGPSFFTKIINKFKNNKITILDSNYLEPCYSKDPYCIVPEIAYADHQHSQSWVEPNILNLVTVYYFFKKYFFLFFLGFSIIYLFRMYNENR